jgi:uncharacterized protein (DUF58 family)
VIYPSARATTLAAAGAVPAFVIALVFPPYWYLGLIWTLGVLAVTLVDALSGASLADLTASATAPASAMVGSAVPVRLRAQFDGPSPPAIEVALGLDDRLGGDSRKKAAGGEIDFALQAKRRGMARLDRLWLRWRGPFGLAWKQHEQRLDRSVMVTPDIGLAREEAVRLFRRDTNAGMIAQLERGVGSEFHSLADYVRGMDRRTIDWKHSARHGRLIAKEYRTEANNNIVLAVDAGRLMSEPVAGLPKLDRAVAAALLAAFVALRMGDRVSLFGFDARPRVASGAVGGTGAFAELQALAAKLDYSEDETNYTLALTALAGRLDRRSLVIVFTDFVDPTSAELMLRSVGRLIERHLVLFVLPRDTELEAYVDVEPGDADAVARAVTAAALLRDRRLVIARLERMGAQIIVSPYDQLGAALVNAYLDIKRRALL